MRVGTKNVCVHAGLHAYRKNLVLNPVTFVLASGLGPDGLRSILISTLESLCQEMAVCRVGL